MRYFTCCCEWSYVVGRKHVYGAIWPAGIGEFPELLSNSQRMMTRAEWKDWYSDCWAHWKGKHNHAAVKGSAVECAPGDQERPGDNG